MYLNQPGVSAVYSTTLKRQCNNVR